MQRRAVRSGAAGRFAVTAGVLAALAACTGNGGIGDLEDGDPSGHQACMTYMRTDLRGHKASNRAVIEAGTELVTADHLAASTTQELNELVEETDPEGGSASLSLGDMDVLIDVCEGYGYEVAQGSLAWIRSESEAGRDPYAGR